MSGREVVVGTGIILASIAGYGVDTAFRKLTQPELQNCFERIPSDVFVEEIVSIVYCRADDAEMCLLIESGSE
jgi:hypothetical protein